MTKLQSMNPSIPLAFFTALGAGACGQASAPLLEMTATEIGAAGGVARSSDGLVALQFSEGALTASQEITVTVIRDHGRPDVVSPVYEFGPSGLEFTAPVVLTVDVPGETRNLALANLDEAEPVVLADSSQSGSALRGTLEHFSSYGAVLGSAAPASSTLAEVTGGTTSILLDLPALAAAGLDVSGFSEEVIQPGDLGPGSIAFPINSRTLQPAGSIGDLPTSFVYDFGSFAPVSGSIEHNGLVYFDQQFGSGYFSIGFDASRATATTSGFFVESTPEGFLLIAEVFFDVGSPSLVDATASSLTIEADLLVSPELAAFLNRPALAGADVGDARISATAR